MTIQFGRRPMEQTCITAAPNRPARKNDNVHKFWTPKNNNNNNKNNNNSLVMETSTSLERLPTAKTPQPQRKMVSFWESKTSSNLSSLTTTSSKSMTSLIQVPEVDEKRGFTPSDVAKDPAKKEFLTNLSKKIFSPPTTNNNLKKHSRINQSRTTFRVRSLPSLTFHNTTTNTH
jgi:hypothetical protein